ncbi:cell wall hydrolase [Bacillus cereus]|uniref:cell wall hydrolase n=1 Tax=Bacillus cereus group TaxID=86661 RepID=UPI0022DFD2A5|nr:MULTISPECIES: cell wall hydrolase [Bacillus cereus group]MDA1509620.1 cell wall hydrolase [Bacillus cereus group sp. TH36-2LC]MDZ4632263.1 cell wall hydrolase [Bacillus cereus]
MKKAITTLALMGGLLFVGGQDAFAYEVKAGDTMSKVAEDQGMSLHTLVSLNPQVSNIDRIFVGQNLFTDGSGVTQETTKIDTDVNTNTSTDVITNLNISGDDFDLLSRLVEAEAGIEPFEGKIAVANVILNRVESDQFPNTIEGVIYEAGQFQPVRNGHINKVPSEESKEAVRKALSVNRSLGGNSLYFYDPRYSTETAKRWFDTLETTMTIGNHVFKTE